ncbi:MAG: bifunctional tetrahydrofolate synthase/dihydrofolate synthase [Ectothiorhodospiraceae bacterium]|nr:bifunctional tetrahydrofolate synthase/dihydrofolate synthase [Ectothiorhodospiraceae bacterium]
MRFQRLDDWLAWQEQLHPRAIDPGLERVRAVAADLDLLTPGCPVLTVAGTNGKGASVAYAEAILGASGYRVGGYTSPHLLRYNERIRIHGEPVSDGALLRAFDAVDRARGTRTLSYFEFGTLAALWLFRDASVDVMVLEVGLGGRLDAVNVLDADVALVTSIGLDHAEWLGRDRESIGREKAGVFRRDRPAVFSGGDMPASVERYAREVGAPLSVAGRDYHVETAPDGRWRYTGHRWCLDHLPPPALQGAVQYANAAGVLRALELLSPRLPLIGESIAHGLGHARLDGRMQHLPGPVDWVLDVAHNADSARVLAQLLAAQPASGRRVALFALMARKDAEAVIAPLRGCFHGWYLMRLPDPDAWTPEALRGWLEAETVLGEGPPAELIPRLDSALAPGDQVVVFGSFRTVEEVLRRRTPGCRQAG